MENPIVFITLLLIIGFYDDIEAGITRLIRSLFRSGTVGQTLIKK